MFPKYAFIGIIGAIIADWDLLIGIKHKKVLWPKNYKDWWTRGSTNLLIIHIFNFLVPKNIEYILKCVNIM